MNCILSIILSIPLLVSYPTSEQNSLSFSTEVEIPGAEQDQIYAWVHDWYVERSVNNIFDTSLKSMDPSEWILVCSLKNLPTKERQHNVRGDLYFYCMDGKCLIEFTNISASVRGEDIMGQGRWHLTADGSQIRRGLAPTYYQRHYRKIRYDIEQNIFPSLCESVKKIMTVYAEMELPLKRSFSAEFIESGYSSKQIHEKILNGFYIYPTKEVSSYRSYYNLTTELGYSDHHIIYRLGRLMMQNQDYAASGMLHIICLDGKIIVELKNIETKYIGENSMYIEHSYKRSYYVEALKEIESTIFPAICESIHKVMTAPGQ